MAKDSYRKAIHWQRLRALHPCFCKAEIILSHLLLFDNICDVLERSGRARLMGSILGATQDKLLGDLLQNLVLVSTAIIDCQSTHSRTSWISWILAATLKNLLPYYQFELEMEPRNPKNGVKNGLKIPPRRSITGVLRRDHNQRTPPRSDGIVNYEPRS